MGGHGILASKPEAQSQLGHAEAVAVDEFTRLAKISEDIIRHIVVRDEK